MFSFTYVGHGIFPSLMLSIVGHVQSTAQKCKAPRTRRSAQPSPRRSRKHPPQGTTLAASSPDRRKGERRALSRPTRIGGSGRPTFIFFRPAPARLWVWSLLRRRGRR